MKKHAAIALAPLLALAACGSNLTPVPGHADYVVDGDDAPAGYPTTPDGSSYQPPDPIVLECSPNLDGRIDAAELQTAYGVGVTYLVNPAGTERTVDLAGAKGEGGSSWDWADDQASDQVATVTATKPTGAWYAPSFPAADFVTPLDAGGSVDAVYRRDDDAIWLLGVASHVADPPDGRTLLVYDEAIPVFRFPLEPGKSWSASATVRDGLLYGLPYAGKDTYEVSVDGIGELGLPDLIFQQALRVRTKTTVAPLAGEPTTKRQVSWFFECFGEVARAASRNDEPAEDFTKATEVRRLGLAGKPGAAPYAPAPPVTLPCRPNLDGHIDAGELATSYGTAVRYRVNPANTEVLVDVAGEAGPDGALLWDWSAPTTTDKLATLVATKLDGKWYAASFPKGEFTTPLDAGGSVDAVYRRDGEALWLLGVASKTEDPAAGKTLLVYDKAVPLFRFPLTPGDAWVASATVTGGTLYGLPYAGKDVYEVAVDGIGELDLPDLIIPQAIRVRTKTTVSPAVGKGTSKRQVSYLFECFGEVARATSANDEPAEDFTTATEVRRLGL